MTNTWCLVTDIDGTLIGESDGTDALRAAVLAERARLEESGQHLYWAIATGRQIDDTCEVLAEHGFAPTDFDAFVTSVGAELYQCDRRALRKENRTPGAHHFQRVLDAGYQQRLAGSGFDARRIRAVTDPLGFEPQQAHEQLPFKVSYYVPDTQEHRQALAEALAALPFAVTEVWSHEHYLDIAPHNGTKGGAVEHLMSVWGLAPERVVAAGDSGNDAAMLSRSWPGIVVGNGHAALAALRGLPQIYFATQKYAAGVLEGLGALQFVPV